MRLRAPTVGVAAVLLEVASGCRATGLQAGPGLGALLAGGAPPLSASSVLGGVAAPGDSIFIVLPWILAIVVSAVVVVLLIRALRNRVPLPGV